MKLLYIIFIVFLIGNLTNSIANTEREDSLKYILNNTVDNSSKAKILVQLAKEIVDIDKKQAIKYYMEASELETESSEKGEIYNSIGLYNWQLGNFKEAIKNYNKSFQIFKALNDSTWLGILYNNLGSINWGIGNSNIALECYQAGLKIREKIDDKNGVALILNNIGLIYQDWEQFDKALTLFKEALEIALSINRYVTIAYSYANIGKCYENDEDFDNALKYYKKGYNSLQKETPNSRTVTMFLANIGDTYLKMRNYDNAYFYYKKSLASARKINNLNRIAISEYKLGNFYYEVNKIDSAKLYTIKSYKAAVENNYSSIKEDVFFLLAKIEEELGNTSKALKYFKEAVAIKDSTFNKEKIAKFTELQIKYSLEKKSQENAILKKNNEIQLLTINKQENIRNILITLGAFLVIISVLIYRSRNSIKSINKKLKQSGKELIELNKDKDKFFSIISHDLKNPLGIIMSTSELLENEYNNLDDEEKLELISILRDSSENINILLESLLNWARIKMGRMEMNYEEINLFKLVEDNINLYKHYSDKKGIILKNNIPKELIVLSDFNMINLIIRNLLTNAIKFTNKGGIIDITSKSEEDKHYIIITDTGIGMSKDDINKLFRLDVHHSSVGTNKEGGTGLGLILCKELVEKHSGKIWVESEPKKGSKFIFTLPTSIKRIKTDNVN